MPLEKDEPRMPTAELQFVGKFDAAGARALAERAALQPRWLRLVVDLSRAGVVEDRALGVFVDTMPRDRHYAFRGLTQHQTRLLRLLGVALEPAQRQGDTG